MEVHLVSGLLHGISLGAASIAGWLGGACATCACSGGNCAGPGAMGAGSAGAGAAAGGGIGPQKIFPLPGGGWFGTDGRAHYSTPDVGIGPVSGHVSTDMGAAPGSDPRGPIVDINWTASAKIGPVDAGSHSGNISAGISHKVQTDVSSTYGSEGTFSGAYVNQFVNSNE